MIEAIFLDYNGVIIDDERLQMQVYQEVFKGQGIRLSEEQYFAALGMDDRRFVQSVLRQHQSPCTDDILDQILATKMVRHRQLIQDELPLCPGVVTFLKATSRQYALGLVSMANWEEIQYVLERARLATLFQVIVTADSVGQCKPAPDCYQCGLEKLNEEQRAKRLLPLLPQECLVVEDSPPGIRSGKLAGMRTLGVTTTVSETALRDAGAEVVTRSLADWTVETIELVFN